MNIMLTMAVTRACCLEGPGGVAVRERAALWLVSDVRLGDHLRRIIGLTGWDAAPGLQLGGDRQ
jgi:hypothetical protein